MLPCPDCCLPAEIVNGYKQSEVIKNKQTGHGKMKEKGTVEKEQE